MITKKTDLSHRMAKAMLHVVDETGSPVADTDIKLTQTNHEFLFGCGAFDAVGYVAVKDENFKNMFKDRLDKWLEVYNYGTLPFYWGRFEQTEGSTDTEKLMAAAKYLTERGTKVKGHPLCWHTVCADWLMQYDNETILRKQLERINREMTDFKGVINMWDVINEVVIMPVFDKYDNAITRICKEKGRVSLVKDVFVAAKQANPEATLLINDFNTSNAYENLIDDCLQAGVPISVIGIQSHQHQGYWGKEKLLEVLERFGHFGLPIHFTENTLISGSLMPPQIDDLNDFHSSEWPSTPEGEERQKNELEEMYRILFAHPLVEAVTGWDFADGAWLNAPSGVIHKDGSVKPSYNMLRNLIKNEWHTDCTVHTDSDGNAVAEGFKGDYILQTGETSCSFTLSADVPRIQAVMKRQ